MYNPHPQCQCAGSRKYRDGNPVALHLELLESRASRIASVGQTAELSVLPGLAGDKTPTLRVFRMWQALGNKDVACQGLSNEIGRASCRESVDQCVSRLTSRR